MKYKPANRRLLQMMVFSLHWSIISSIFVHNFLFWQLFVLHISPVRFVFFRFSCPVGKASKHYSAPFGSVSIGVLVTDPSAGQKAVETPTLPRFQLLLVPHRREALKTGTVDVCRSSVFLSFISSCNRKKSASKVPHFPEEVCRSMWSLWESMSRLHVHISSR